MGGDDTSGDMRENAFVLSTEFAGGSYSFDLRTIKLKASNVRNSHCTSMFRWQCAIPRTTGSVVVTGGEGRQGYLNYAFEYNEDGFFQIMSPLRQKRCSHGSVQILCLYEGIR